MGYSIFAAMSRLKVAIETWASFYKQLSLKAIVIKFMTTLFYTTNRSLTLLYFQIAYREYRHCSKQKAMIDKSVPPYKHTCDIIRVENGLESPLLIKIFF